MANWSLLGEIEVRNSPQFFPSDSVSNIFRITTTIDNQQDWDIWRFRSSAKLYFFYPDGSISMPTFIKYNFEPLIIQINFPDIDSQEYFIRTPALKRSSRYLPLTSDDNFAKWKIKLEELI